MSPFDAARTRVLPDGRIAEIIPLTYGRARLVVTTVEDYGYTYDDGW